MNNFKISGKVIKTKKIGKNDLFVNVVLAVPLNYRIYDENNLIKQQYNYISFSIFGLDQEQYRNLRKGNYVEISGMMAGNCDENGNLKKDLIIFPKSIMKGVIK